MDSAFPTQLEVNDSNILSGSVNIDIVVDDIPMRDCLEMGYEDECHLHDFGESVDATEVANVPDQVSSERGIVWYSPGGSRYWIPDVLDKPITGKVYATHEDVFQAYKMYGDKSGFEVRKGTSRLNKGVVVSKYMVCNKEGANPNPRAKGGGVVPRTKWIRKRRITGLTNCRAHIRIRINGLGQYVIDEFEERHNHPLVSEEDMPLLKSRRRLSYTQQSLMHRMSNYNIGPNKSHEILSAISGGSNILGASVVDFKNFKRDMLQFIGDVDAQMVVQKMMLKKESDDDFSFDVLLGEDNVLSAMFWADEVSKRNYFAFGDVVSFDATFRTNKYKMVFVPFTGIDNHQKCVTFGAGLLSCETIESYRWLLAAFLSAFGREPKIVVTDQDPAMRQAIRDLFPSATHRICLWHVMNKVTMKVGARLCATTNFRKRFNDLVWNDELDPDVFQCAWEKLIYEFGLCQNKWLRNMYKIRDRWIPAFFRDISMSGLMRTTSRSESENKFFQKVLNANLTLVEFVSHFETAMYFQRAKERLNDHDSRYKRIELKSTLDLEKHASELYTISMFEVVQNEVIASNESCICLSSTCEGDVKKSLIVDNEVEDESRSTFQVVFDTTSMHLKCSCTLFERHGYLCRHSFYVLRLCKHKEIPASHIISLWLKNATPKIGYSVKRHMIPGIKEPTEALIRELFFLLNQLVNRFVGVPDMLSTIVAEFKDFIGRFEGIGSVDVSKEGVMSSLLGVSQPDEVNIHALGGIRNKGCGRPKRFISAYEESRAKVNKPKRRCRCCNSITDHDSRNFPKKQAADQCASS